MDVIHKTFTGGYKFGIFEGQPPKKITKFNSVESKSSPVINPDKDITAVDVLNALGHTAFNSPESASIPSEGFIDPSKVKNIVISTVEVEPYDLSNEAILGSENKSSLTDGLKSIHQSYNKAKVTIVLGDDQTDLLGLIEQEVKDISWLDVATIVSKYPANLKELLIPTVFDKKYPVGYSPAHLGMLFLSVRDVLMVSKVVNQHQPLATTFVALSGTGWKENLILEVAIGTPISEIKKAYLAEGEVRIIKNSVLTKETFADDDAIDYGTSVIIALPEDRKRQSFFFLRSGKNADSFSRSFLSSLMPKADKVATTNVQGERRACVSCTYCQKVCPVGLIPHLLHKHVDKKIINERLAEYRIFDCIECGLCDYVCPSKIEVSSDIKKGKAMLEANEISHNKYIIPYCDMILKAEEVKLNE